MIATDGDEDVMMMVVMVMRIRGWCYEKIIAVGDEDVMRFGDDNTNVVIVL